MTDIDFIIFEFYFLDLNLKNKKVLNLYLGNVNIIKEIEQKYPVKIKYKHIVDPNKIEWSALSENPNAIHLLSQNLDKIDWRELSGNPEAVYLIEAILHS
jgi:hypothetical protein